MSRKTVIWVAGLLLVGCNAGPTGASATEGQTSATTNPAEPLAPVTDGSSATMGASDSNGGTESSGTGTASMGGETPTSGDPTGAVTASTTTSGEPDPVNTTTTGAAETAGASGGTGDGGTTEVMEQAPPVCVPVECEGKLYECGDCVDNDGDGKADAADPECIGPCDDREDAFATGLPGDNVDPCKQDCFFDGNSGAKSGECNWNLKCDPLEPLGDVCAYDEDFKCPAIDGDTCLNGCQVPNGCDCFGCCTIEVGGKAHDIYIGDPNCSLANFDKCMACTKVETCVNACQPKDCEVCFGETELPPGCEAPNCEAGLEPCVNSVCPEGFFCSPGSGCCYPAPG